MNTLASVRFRDAVASDLPALVGLDAICFTPEMRYSAEVMRFFAFHRNSRAIVAVDEKDSIVAFVIAHVLRTGIGEVVTLDVTPQARRQKLGEALMERAEGWFRERGVRGIHLEVDDDNAPAIALYEKFGYQVRHPFYEDGKRRLLMEKTLRSGS